MELKSVKQRFNLDKKSGQKRESFSWSYQGFADTEDVNSVPNEIVCAALNSVLEGFGLQQIRQHAKDWHFRPKSEEINLKNWYVDYTAAITRTRAVTAVTLANFASVYAELSVSLLGKSSAVASAGATVIKQKLLPIMGQKESLAKMQDNILNLCIAVESSESPEILDDHQEVIEALIEVIKDGLGKIVTSDDL